MAQKVAVLVGGAGTGKTTELLGVMEAAKTALGGNPHSLGFASFTRAARAEAVARASAAWNVQPESLSRDGWFRTVHSTAYRQLGIQKGQLIDDSKASQRWVADALGVDVRVIMDDDSGYSLYAGEKAAASALNCWEISRARVEPLVATIKRMAATGQEPPTYADCKQFITRYEDAKRLEERVDYSDLLARFAGLHFDVDGFYEVDPQGKVPAGVKAWIFDEAQDASALVDRVCKRLAGGPEVLWVYLAGDPFQCQPAGTPVLTAAGYKPIEELDPEKDRIIAFNKKDGRFYGTGGGTRFQRAFRDVDSGDLIEVTFEDGTKSVCTTNHKWVVRTVKRDAYATYLMRKGDRWRVGTVQMFSKKASEKNGEFRLKMRMNQENAESAWVLKVFETDREARAYEQVVSCRFGIPQVTFRPPNGKTNLDAGFIESVFSELGDLTVGGLRCLFAHGLEVDFPFCAKADRAKNGSKACRLLQAANLLPGIHVVPKLLEGFFERRKRGSGNARGSRNIGKEANWVGVTSVRRMPAGSVVRVYSLNVEKHHTYVTTNGIVTGNSIFSFGGSDYRHFLNWPADKKRTMEKSWRCPQNVMDLGERCLKQMHEGYWDRGIAPADHPGEIVRGGAPTSIIPKLDPREKTLILARCNYTLDDWAAIMKAKGIPFSKLKAKENTNAIRGIRALWDLEHGEAVSGDDFACAVAEIPARGADGPLMVRGAKAAWERDSTKRKFDVVFPSTIETTGMTASLAERILSGRWAELVIGGERWRAAAQKFGAELATHPHIRIGTIHAAKGMESDTVVLSTTTSRRVFEGQQLDREQHDEERRIEYVGVTRARKKLIVSSEPCDYRMNLKL